MRLGSCNLYADDTLIYCIGSNIVELKTNIKKCGTDVHEWYESNKLAINTSKSNVMLLTNHKTNVMLLTNHKTNVMLLTNHKTNVMLLTNHKTNAIAHDRH